MTDLTEDGVYLVGFVFVKGSRGRRDEERGRRGGGGGRVETGNGSGVGGGGGGGGRGRVALFLIRPHFRQRVGIGVALRTLVAVVALQKAFVLANCEKISIQLSC